MIKRLFAVLFVCFAASAAFAEEIIIPPPPPPPPTFPPQMGAWEVTVYNAKRVSDYIEALITTADEIKAMDDLEKRRVATDAFVEKLKRLLDMFAELRIPRDWCLPAENDLPAEPLKARERLVKLKPCMAALMDEAKNLESSPKPDFSELEDVSERMNAFIKEKQKTRLKSQQETALGQFWEGVQEWVKTLIKKFFGVAKTGEYAGQTFDRWVSVAVALAFSGLLIFLAYRLFRKIKNMRRREAKPQSGLALSGSAPLSALVMNSNWEEADKLAKQGRNREAFRLYFHAWMSVLSDVFGSPLPRFDETNREWLARALPSLPDEAGRNSKTAAEAFDRHWYGLVEPDDESVSNFRALLINLATDDK